jgi:hypothetical protein
MTTLLKEKECILAFRCGWVGKINGDALDDYTSEDEARRQPSTQPMIKFMGDLVDKLDGGASKSKILMLGWLPEPMIKFMGDLVDKLDGGPSKIKDF